MDRLKLGYEVVQVYVVSLLAAGLFSLLLLIAPPEFRFRVVTQFWYHLAGLAILTAVTYRTFNQRELTPTAVAILFLLWTGFLESVLYINTAAGRIVILSR